MNTNVKVVGKISLERVYENRSWQRTTAKAPYDLLKQVIDKHRSQLTITNYKPFIDSLKGIRCNIQQLPYDKEVDKKFRLIQRNINQLYILMREAK